MPDQVFVQVRFQREVKGGLTFSDALYFTQAEYAGVTQAQKDTLIAQRVDGFREAMRTQPAPRQPTRAELLELKADLERQVRDVSDRIDALPPDLPRR